MTPVPETVTKRFLNAFDPGTKTHVVWLKEMTDMAETLADPNKPQDIVAMMSRNPMKVKFSQSEALDWPHVHFVLCASYARAVFNCKAWVPGLPTAPGLSVK
jgi:hypothetical protein